MPNQQSKCKIKDLSFIRDVSNDEIDSSKMNSVVGGHKYHEHYKPYDLIDKSIKDFVKDFFGQIKEVAEPEAEDEIVFTATVFVGGLTPNR